MDLPSCAWPSTPIRKLEEEYARCMRASQEDLDLEPAIYFQEGSELLSQLRDELAMLPELKDLSPECDISKADVGDPDRTTAAEEKKLRSILTYHRKIFLGDGNAAPAPARGVVCDLDVGDAKPVAQRPRSIAPHIMLKVYELLKKLLETELIEFSVSAWASPIVIVLKKNGVDIRMCIDYRVVNGFIQLATYPLPLIDDLLIGFESAMWFMSLDMASGFWAIRMTERAKLISAFVCPFGHFQWSKTADGRCVRWGVILSHWNLEVHKIQRDEDGLPAILGAGITPREHLDEVAESLIPAKGRVKAPPVISMEMLEADFSGYVLSFDGAAKTSTRQGSCGCILWELPGWNILAAHGFILEDVTVNDAEYYGLLKGLTLASEREIQDLVVVGDSRIVIQQVQGLINCNQPNLQRRLSEVGVLKEKFTSMRLVHVKREYNQAADYLTSKTLALGTSWQTEDPEELKHLVQVSKIHEKLMKPLVIMDENTQDVSPQEDLPVETPNDIRPGPESAPLSTAARIMVAVTRSRIQEQPEQREPMGPLEYQAERWRRIKAHQECDDHLMEIKRFLKGDLYSLSRSQIRRTSIQAELYALDVRDVLYRLSRSTKDRPRDMSDELRLVVPESLCPDLLHYAHEDFQGGHQGITRTHEKLRSEFYWPGMYADMESFVKECVDCASGKGRPPNPGPPPGNIEPRYPFEVVSMDFVTHLPKSEQGNTFLLLFQDTFSGYVMCQPMDSTTAQDVAEAYEERVFRSFGAGSLLRHDQDPRFMSEVFTRFRELLGSRQRATLTYRPQANGQQERSVQTVIRSVRAYVAESDQSDWDEHAERLMFALNTSYDATRHSILPGSRLVCQRDSVGHARP
ncbi:hypothetical protein PR001_g24264 [Phytophthora rubi]|uniref:Integrase catalytic domain-containing protein n=1 Tax=Phytophthora rubi TaxID=129364 RepID=A0A6A3IK51_9STRA|nr:hypothetical protein PR001_g24264 [Phytophthora rubi]